MKILKYNKWINENEGGGDAGDAGVTTTGSIEGMGDVNPPSSEQVGSGDTFQMFKKSKTTKSKEKKKKSDSNKAMTFKEFKSKIDSMQPK